MKQAAKPILQWLAGLLLAVLASSATAGEPSQQPLLTRATAVAPNLLLLFDDSDSMNYRYVYEYKNRTDSRRWFGLNPTPEELNSLKGDNKPLADGYAFCAPELNTIAYNPDKRYDPAKNADGSFKPLGAISTARTGQTACRDASYNPVVFRFPNRYFIFDLNNYNRTTIISSNNSYPKTAKRTDCLGTSCTYQEEIQNYANYYWYHRTRLAIFKTALSHAIAAAPGTLRLGATGINSLTINGLVDVVPVALDKPFTSPILPANNRKLLQQWLEGKTTVSGTRSNEALYQAGMFFTRSDSDGPWGTTPNPFSRGTSTVAYPASLEPSKNHASCRRSYAMLVTDGYYTDLKDIGEVDNVTGTKWSNSKHESYQYTPVAPFRSPYKGGMADIAMQFWGTDLRAGTNGIDNNVSPIPPGINEDPAFWQHLNFMAVTLGLDGTLPRTQQTLDAIKVGNASWPAPAVLSPASMDDIWHATLNGRGDLVNVTDSEGMVQAFTTLVSGILRTAASLSGVAASTSSLTTNTKKFIPVFISGQWTGNLIATRLDPATGKVLKTEWEVESTNKDTGEEQSNKLGPPAERNIVVGTGGTAPTAVPFKYGDMSAALRDRVSTTDAAKLIDYLRGDRTYEAGDNNLYRKRPFILGDIINSNPVFVGPDFDQGYGKLANKANADSYIAYLNEKHSRPEGLVFVGANDGMLHAFRESDGKEVFAYVPHAVLPNLNKLARKDYEHRYFVDGPVTIGDFQRPNAKWQTMVLASAGAGAKSVFAINATTNNLGTASVWWEVNSETPGFEEMGNVLSEVRMGRRNGGSHIAVFGNGPYSKSGIARLYVVNAMTGALLRELSTKVGDGNGLGGVELVLDDYNIVVGAYAGDLKGNLWKFDMRSTDPLQWNVSSQPVFKATTASGMAQPITGAPLSIKHPDGGRVVVLGTGKFFDAADVTNTDQQTIYGVRDKDAFTNLNNTSIEGTSTLVKQELITKTNSSQTITAFDNTTSTQTVTYYEVTVNAIDWKAKNGWYFHQPFDGQRMVYPVSAFTNKLAKIDTITPGTQSADPCLSASPGMGYSYIIDILTGGSPQSPVFDTNGDGAVDNKDDTGSGYGRKLEKPEEFLSLGSGGGGGGTPSCPPEGGPPIKFVLVDSSGGSRLGSIECPCTLAVCPDKGSGGGGGKTVKSRSWQQLFLR